MGSNKIIKEKRNKQKTVYCRFVHCQNKRVSERERVGGEFNREREHNNNNMLYMLIFIFLCAVLPPPQKSNKIHNKKPINNAAAYNTLYICIYVYALSYISLIQCSQTRKNNTTHGEKQ